MYFSISGSCSVTFTPPPGIPSEQLTVTATYTGFVYYLGSIGSTTVAISSSSTTSTSTTTSTASASSSSGETTEIITTGVGGGTYPTSTSVNCLPNPVYSGGYLCTAVVMGNGQIPPSGFVTMRTSSGSFSGSPQGDYIFCDLTAAGSCQANLVPGGSPGTAGFTFTVDAIYYGNSIYAGSSGSTTYASSTAKIPTFTSVVCVNNLFNSNNTCTAYVSALGAASPPGTVTLTSTDPFGSFGQSICTLSGGSCSVSYSPSEFGPATIYAIYSGNSVYEGRSGSTTITITTTTFSDGNACADQQSGTGISACITGSYLWKWHLCWH